MSVTREELQEAGASPELARILAERLPRRGAGDPARHPMAVTLAGIVLAAFLSTLGWLVLGMSDLKSDVARLDERMSGIEGQVSLLREGQARLEEKVDGLDQRTARIEDKLDKLVQQQ